MAKRLPRGGQPQGRFGRVSQTARRLWPVVLEAWRRWEQLPPHQKERYRRMAGDAARQAAVPVDFDTVRIRPHAFPVPPVCNPNMPRVVAATGDR